jgi:hypothetical protein
VQRRVARRKTHERRCTTDYEDNSFGMAERRAATNELREMKCQAVGRRQTGGGPWTSIREPAIRLSRWERLRRIAIRLPAIARDSYGEIDAPTHCRQD